MTPLSVAIIGAGNIAGGFDERKQGGDQGIYTHAGAYAAHGGFRLRTVLDADPARARQFAEAWKADACASELRELCGSRHDVISICTPDATHFEIARTLLESRCCRTIFIEKPLAFEGEEIEELMRLSAQTGIHLAVNFQRRYEPSHRELRELVASRPDDLLSVTGHYMKGLRHIGVTMIDSLCHLCGYPEAVLTFRRVLNREVEDYSYEFVLFYPGFSVVVKTTDAERFHYNYHLFELDFLFADKRIALVDISQAVRETPVTGYAYSGVRVLNERQAHMRETGYKHSMLDAARYLHDITTGKIAHAVNTPQSSFDTHLIINAIIESWERGSVKLNFEQGSWKR